MFLSNILCLFLLENLYLGVLTQNLPLSNPSCSFQDPSGYFITWGLDSQQNLDFYLSYPNFPIAGGFWTGIGFGSTNELNAILVETQNGQVVVSPAQILLDLQPQRANPLLNADGLLSNNNLQASFSVPLQVVYGSAYSNGCIQFSFFTNPTRSDSPWNGQAITRNICNLQQCIQRFPFSSSYSQYGNSPYMNPSSNSYTNPTQYQNQYPSPYGSSQYYNQPYPGLNGYNNPSMYGNGLQNYGNMPQNYGYGNGYNGYGINNYDSNSVSDFVIENPNYKFLPDCLRDEYACNYQMQQSNGFGNYMNGRGYGFMNSPIFTNDQQNQMNYQDILQREGSSAYSPYYTNTYGYNNNPYTPYNNGYQPYMNAQYQPYSSVYGRKKREIQTLENLIRIVKRQEPNQAIYYPYRTETNSSTSNNSSRNTNRQTVAANSSIRNNSVGSTSRPIGLRCAGGSDPDWCADYVKNFMEWKTKHVDENASTTQVGIALQTISLLRVNFLKAPVYFWGVDAM
uniref:DOMON domain-containing protein n=1 Tax=Acrobeloides nanus TaxID=290746 RepID=A0A914D3L7_9BILA